MTLFQRNNNSSVFRGLKAGFVIFAMMSLLFLFNVPVALAASLTDSHVDAGHAGGHIPGDTCDDLPSHEHLREALINAWFGFNGGFDLEMWGTIVNRDGVVCAVAFTGEDRGAQWPGSRVISAQKANTANAFSLPGLALSTANIFSAVQPGGSLYGLQHSNPVNTVAAYQGSGADFGFPNDPMVGERIGGINVFGGGLALYNSEGELIGGLGVSGDTSCADHSIAWRTRHGLGLDFVPGGVSGDPDRPDNIVYDLQDPTVPLSSASGWGHANCLDVDTEVEVAETLPPTNQAIPFEAIETVCEDVNIVESDEPLIAGTSFSSFAEEIGADEFIEELSYYPDAYDDGTWETAGMGTFTPDGDYSATYRGYGTGELDGGIIIMQATPADVDYEDLPCEPYGPVSYLSGVIVLPHSE